MNPKTILKKLFKTLESQYPELEEALAFREEKFNERSEKWIESEKGEFHQQETEEMEDILSSIESLRDEINSFINA